MATCHKCFKQNPEDAVFCGYCGGGIVSTPEAQSTGTRAAAKTVFGYNLAQPVPAGTPSGGENEPAGRQAAGGPAAAVDAEQPGIGATPEPVASVGPPLTPAGTVVAGRFRLVAGIRRLPVGELHAAQDTAQGDEVEVVLVDSTALPSPVDIERARRELRQLQKVDCPALMKIIDHGKAEDGRVYVALERVAGRALDEIVSASPLDLAETQRVISALGVALTEAQKMGVIHRDIAPQNVVIGGDGAVKLRGFGVAPIVSRQVYGTPAFLSPEQALARPVDQRSNIYSLGALMFYMLTGEPPFSAASDAEMLEKHQKEEPVSPRARRPELELPAAVEALVLKALAKSSSRRHLTLRQFLREVDSTGPDGATVLESGPETESGPISLRQQTTSGPGGHAHARELPSESAQLARTIANGTLPAAAAKTLVDRPVEPAPSASAAQVSAGDSPVIELRRPIAAPKASGKVGQGATAAGSSVSLAYHDSPASHDYQTTPHDPIAPVTTDYPDGPLSSAAASRGNMRTGELTTDVSLKKVGAGADSGAAAPSAQVKTSGPSPAAGQADAAPPVVKGKSFRETLWFYKGEVESAMAAEGGETPAVSEVEPQVAELAAKYADDGSLSEEEAQRLSLRTGKTQAMMQVNAPRRTVPGEKMAAEDFIQEMNRGRRIAIWVGIFVVLAAASGLVVWLLVK